MILLYPNEKYRYKPNPNTGWDEIWVGFKGDFIDKVLRKNIAEEVAAELQVGHSWFRKVVKKYTGLAPGQYLIQLKIQKGKELLADPSKLNKEIAYKLHLESSLYFQSY